MEAGYNILVVEDHADTRKALSLLLRHDGYLVHEAEGCASALALAHQRHFDLALCDIKLRDGDGCELLQKLQQIYPLPAIAVTAHGRKEDIRRCLEAGFKVHILKPFDYSTLRSEMAKLLRSKHAG